MPAQGFVAFFPQAAEIDDARDAGRLSGMARCDQATGGTGQQHPHRLRGDTRAEILAAGAVDAGRLDSAEKSQLRALGYGGD